MGYQFIHLETYSRKADSEGRSVEWILAEARRDPDASLHVEFPQAPEVVLGISLDQLATRHSELAEGATTTLKSGKTRKIRKDQKSLLTIVASYPVPFKELTKDPEGLKSLKNWERRTVEWLQSLYGDDLVSVVRHTDERYPHLHAYILPQSDPELRALRMHPGHEAKRIVMESDSATDNKKELNRRGDRAYREAMRSWQDSYHHAVGIPSGLTRLGPKRRRLSREAWHAEKQAAKAVKTAEVQAAKYVEAVKTRSSAYADRVRAEASAIRSSAKLHAEEAKAAQTRATRLERRAQRVLERARAEATRILEAAAPYRKLGSLFRSIWDGLNSSTLKNRIRSELSTHIEHMSRKTSEERKARRHAERRAEGLEKEIQNSRVIQAASSREIFRLKRRLEAELGSKAKELTPNSPRTEPSGGVHGY
ncbi:MULTISPECIES: plasmid recombination protein [unclassified Roseibium]|uniref:plasmid recombination protein n=1 Tax=unclassified Roseibium TaxID=2629323 RepID=UPI00273F62C0|nr:MULTISPECIES: plasmid recombination protein [unclassified Roseibium]